MIGRHSCFHSTDAATKLAWAGFLRCGEFTVPDTASFDGSIHLSRASVKFFPSIESPTFMELTIPASKTDPFRGGVTVCIAAAPGSVTCPVQAMKHLFAIHPLPDSAPLFADASGSPLMRSQFIRRLKLRLTDVGIDSSGYSGHSFRRGAATAAAIAGLRVPDSLPKLTTQNDKYRDRP